MNEPTYKVENLPPHCNVLEDGKVIRIFNDILNPNALTDAYKLKKELEES